MKYSAFVLILVCGPTVACEIPPGKYEAITESEYSLSLILFEDNQYHFAHKNWLPGDLHHVGEEHIYKGIYECKDNKITLKYNDSGKDIKGEHIKRNLKENHFPMDKSSMVLDFSKTERTKSKIAGWYYWPETFLKDVFK